MLTVKRSANALMKYYAGVNYTDTTREQEKSNER